MNNPSYLVSHQAHLFAGDAQTVLSHVAYELQQALCQNNACTTCSTCLLIAQKQHPFISHLAPENSYTLEQIDEILEATRFKLGKQEKRFFIFTQAEQLTLACSNRLLKTIEEPHAGYFFIFITSNVSEMLPTLISRCLFKQLQHGTAHHEFDAVMYFFAQFDFVQPLECMKTLEKLGVKEQETSRIVDAMLAKFYQELGVQYQDTQHLDSKKISLIMSKIVLIKQALRHMPVQASSKIFWKNMYLAFHQEFSCLKN